MTIQSQKERVAKLNEEAFALRFIDFRRALHLAETSLALIGESPDFLSEKAFALNAKGIAHYTLGDDINAVECFHESLRLACLIGDKKKKRHFCVASALCICADKRRKRRLHILSSRSPFAKHLDFPKPKPLF